MRFRNVAPTLLALFLACLLIFKTECVMESVRSASHLCADTVFPSLFPFMFLSAFIGIYLKGSQKSAIFSAILLGTVGGYPVGIKTVSTLLESGKIGDDAAQKLGLFCFGSGPAFLIGTIGVGFFGNIKAGIILLVSQLVSTFFIGAFVFRSFKTRELKFKEETSIQLSDAFTKAVSISIQSVVTVCAYVVLFSVLISLVTDFKSGKGVDIILSTLEVTNGSKIISKLGATKVVLPFASALLSFGGFCVHAQVLSDLKSIGIPYPRFLTARILAAAISFLTTRTILLLFPSSLEVLSNISQPLVPQFEASGTIFIAMLLMTSLLIFDLDIKREI